jgi:tetratricopeptide (TPR) repeat protein
MENPRHLRARFNLAVLYHDQQHYRSAKRHYKRLLEQYPEHARSLINLADIATAEDESSKAHYWLLRAVDAEPVRAYPYSFLGRFFQSQGKRQQARAAYERALALEDDAVTHYRLGTLWLEEGKVAEARQHFDHAVKLDSRYADALYALSKLAMDAGDTATALRYLQRLSHLAPNRADIFALLGRLYFQQGEDSTAALHLWEARDIEPNAPGVEQLLLQVYQRMLQRQQEVVNRLSSEPKRSLAGVAPEKPVSRR